jgi:ATP-binding cassette subfamily C protein
VVVFAVFLADPTQLKGGHMRQSGEQGANPYRDALRRLRPPLMQAGVFSAAVNILMLTGPLYMLQVYDRVLGSGSMATLAALTAVVLLLYAFFGLYEFLRMRILARAACRLDALIAAAAFALGLRSGLADPAGGAEGGGPATRPAGAQALRDLETVRGFLGGPAILGLFDLPWIPFYVALVFVLHPVLGWLTLAGAVVVTVVALANHRLTEGAIAAGMAHEGAERAFVEQGRRSAELIAALGMAGRVTERWRQMHVAGLATSQGASDRTEVAAAFSKTFRMLLQSALLTAGAWLALRQEITPGMIVAGSIIAGRALAPVDQVIGQWRSIGRAREAHRRCIAAFAPDRAAAAPIRLPAPTGALRVTGLTKYAPGRQPGAERLRILDRVSFALEPGEGLGVIGNSASGKSTLARLLVGAWVPDAGEIRLDGATHAQWDPEDLGRHIGYLPQAVEMLPGTIRDNIARFDPEAPDEAVIEAARIAGVHEMILRLPEGYVTRLGQDRMPLSGGQVQRLGLARALYGSPRIIVLDEPNSNLDAVGDDALAAAIAAMRAKGSVVIVMAHRPSAIAAVSKVMILHNGAVAQFGSKEEVMQPSRTRLAAAPAAAGAAAGTAAGAAPGPAGAAAPPVAAAAHGPGAALRGGARP